MALLAVVLALLVPPVLFLPNYLAGTHTSYCPLSHRFSGTAACSVLDERDGEVLIQHADPATDERYLELWDESGSRLYALPPSVAKMALGSYTAQLIPGGVDLVVIDGVRQRLVPLELEATATWPN